MNKQTAQLLEQHFDTAFAAPDGVAKLRALILTLAMQGKLVEQNPNDPPASELLREIEKERVSHEGTKTRRKEKLPPLKPEEVPYELPQGWKWVRFGDIAQHNSGKTLDKGRNTGEPRDYITTSNLYWGRFELDNVRQMLIRDDDLEKCTARKNDLLICEGGEAGRAAVWHFDSEVCFQNHVHRARFYKDIDPYFAFRFFEKLNATGEINQHRKGVGISNMSSKALASIVFPLPSLPEQHRIVARIDQLMARCDALEKLRKEREEKRLAVHAAAIKQLLDSDPSFPRRRESSSSEELAPRLRGGDGKGRGSDGVSVSAWDFIQQHFGELYTVKENVAELRKAILQLAVMGRLVPQDPNDPPASELLKEIEAEKQLLVKSGKIKKPKPLPPISPEEVPYGLPQGWEWVRFGNVASNRLGKMLDKSKNRGNPKPYLRNTNVQWHQFVLDDVKEMKFEDDELDEFRVLPGDLLICEGGEPGRCAIWSDSEQEIYFQKAIHRARPFSCVISEFLLSCLTNDAGNGQLVKYFTGATIKHFPGDKLNGYVIPLPPLPEQHRIVARIDQLMALCYTLDQQIDAAAGKQTELLGAVMAEV